MSWLVKIKSAATAALSKPVCTLSASAKTTSALVKTKSAAVKAALAALTFTADCVLYSLCAHIIVFAPADRFNLAVEPLELSCTV